MALEYPIGVDDFRKLREQHLEYVDKSDLIREVLAMRGREVLLLPRPRRFGKTLNLSMLRYFLEKRDEDLSHLFETLNIWRDAESRAHFQRYPVIHLTFKGVKFDTFERFWESLRGKLQALFQEHAELLEDATLTPWELQRFQAILEGTGREDDYHTALLTLSRHLHQRHGERVVILIDEYDEPLHAGFVHGYLEQVLQFFRAFLSEGLKGNPHLYKAVLTGILRVARESIFSGLNNLAVYTLLRPELSTSFGFTEAEVAGLMHRAGQDALLEPVRRWYNGYVFGGQVIYNPWSVLNFLASEDKLLRGYWTSTSANDLIKDLLQHYALSLEPELEILLQGGALERRLDENVVLPQLRESDDALWSLLVLSGYLRAEAGEAASPHEVPPYRLSIPNREVREVYTSTFRQWMETHLGGRGGRLRKLTDALLQGNAEQLEAHLQTFVTNLLSYHDPVGIAPEQVYHAFVVGLLAALEPEYQVRSNRESGLGRPDILVRPMRPNRPGVVLELKVAKPQRATLEQALEEGLTQLHEKGYGAELRESGAEPIHALSVAFDGKQVRVAYLRDGD